jgi:DNA-binding response OmpR family regulator
VAPRVAVLADDLIWSTRLAAHLREAGAEPVVAASVDALRPLLPAVSAVVVDLTALRYDGIAALELVRAAGVRSLAVGQHDDVEVRKRALAAGAERVYAYRKLFEDGAATMSRWLEIVGTTS